MRTISTQPGVRRESASTLAMSGPVEARKPAWPRIGQVLAGFADEADVRPVFRDIAEGDVAGVVSAGVVDHDDFGEVLEAGGLIEDGFEAGAEIGLFVVCRDDEAEQHAPTVAELCVGTLNFRCGNPVGYRVTTGRRRPPASAEGE